METTECQICGYIYDYNYKYDENIKGKNKCEINYSIFLNKTDKQRQLFDLLKNSLCKRKYNNKCYNCRETKSLTYNYFYNSPLYLIIELEDGKNVIIDEKIDLTNYILTNLDQENMRYMQ